jgi:hypothetical protein
MKFPFAAAACVMGVLLSGAPASASLDTAIAPRVVIQNQPLSDCSARASSALKSVINDAREAGTGSGLWFGAILDPQGNPSTTAVVECHDVPNGYAASFTCLVQVPPSEAAASLCQKIATAFSGGAK